jgi:hypothetical protein
MFETADVNMPDNFETNRIEIPRMPTTLVFCYHCTAQHPRSEMRLVTTKTGNRWRCKTSINAAARAAKDIALRQAFGKITSDKNKLTAKLTRQAKKSSQEINSFE